MLYESVMLLFYLSLYLLTVPVKSVRKVLMKQQKVLVVWTPCGQHGECFGPVVAAFKRILQSYAHCQVGEGWGKV